LWEEIRHRLRCWTLWAALLGVLAALVWLGLISGSVRDGIAALDVVEQTKTYVAETARHFVEDRATTFLRNGNGDQGT
jgi:hypothetical protein